MPISLLLNLYRQKLKAEKAGDKTTLAALEKDHPEIFTADFEDFVYDVKETTLYLDQEYDGDFIFGLLSLMRLIEMGNHLF